MADKYQTLLNGERVLIEATVTGGTVGEAGDVLALGADGRIDDKEKKVLQDAIKRLGFAEESILEISEFLLKQAKENKSFMEVLQTINNS